MSDDINELDGIYGRLLSGLKDAAKAAAHNEIRIFLAAQWQPIETAPKDGSYLVLWDDGRNGLRGYGLQVGYWDDDWLMPDTQVGGYNRATPTHWLCRCPDPPK